jgi:hypothetical protein
MRRLLAAGLLLFVAALAACAPAAPDELPSAIPARVLEPWTPMTDSFVIGDLAREWRLLGQKRDEIVVTVASERALEVVLTDADGVALAQGNPLRAVLPEAGTYRVVVAAAEPAVYKITLTIANQPTPTPTFTATFTPSATFTLSPTPLQSNTPTPTLTPTATFTPSATPTPVYAPLGELRGELVDGAIHQDRFISSFERHVVLFEGRAGQYVTLALDGQDQADGALALFGPGGVLIAMDDDSGGGLNSRLAGIRLEADGTTIVQVTNGGGPGAYTLALTLSERAPIGATATPAPTAALPVGQVTPVPQGGPMLADHAPVLGRLDAPGDVARYTLRLGAGDIFSVAAQPAPGSALLPRIQAANPAGEVIFESGLLPEAGAALLPAFGVMEAGTYSIYVSGDNRTSGDFVLAFGLGQSHTDVLRGFAPAETPLDGALTQRGLRDVWTVELAAGDRIRVALMPLVGGFAPALTVVGPNGQVAVSASAERSAPNPAVEFEAPLSGRYRLQITGGGALTYGPYRLEWSRLGAASEVSPPLAVPVLTANDVLAADSYRDYVFQGTAGDRLRLRVIARTSELDPVAALFGPDGALLAQADDSPGSLNPDLELTLPASGSFTWRVNGYNGAAGEVEVRIERLVGGDEPAG